MKKTFKFLGRLVLMVLAFATGASSDVLMANATNLPDAGVIEAGAASTDATAGIATETAGRDNGDPDFYLEDVDKRIVKIRPMATPIDQISRYAKSSETKSFEVKYYSVGTREIKCITSAKMNAMTNGASATLQVSDVNMFTVDDTIRVVGVKGITNYKGNAYDPSKEIVPDLVLCVCGKDTSSNLPIVYAVNGNKDENGQPIWIPEIPVLYAWIPWNTAALLHLPNRDYRCTGHGQAENKSFLPGSDDTVLPHLPDPALSHWIYREDFW